MMSPSKFKKIAIVIPRFHPEIAGGAEKLALDYALILKDQYSIEVFSTCSKDYTTWKNELEIGPRDWNGIIVHRFPVRRERKIRKMNKILNYCLSKGEQVKVCDEEKFIEEQGPYSPELVDGFLSEEYRFDLVLLVGYLYYPILKILPKLTIKSIIIPTFHDEPVLGLPIYSRTFLPSHTYAFNSPEEVFVFEKRFGRLPNNYAIIGTYVNVSENFLEESETINTNGSEKILLLTLGRIEAAKAFPELFQYFHRWSKYADTKLIRWISIGSNHLDSDTIPNEVEVTGFVSENEKRKLISKASLIINPSPFESFSIAMMEAWSFGKPVLVNAKSEVMVGHNLRSLGGLHYSDEISFKRCLEYLIERPQLRKRLGENGKRYVLANFTKEIINQKLTDMISKLPG